MRGGERLVAQHHRQSRPGKNAVAWSYEGKNVIVTGGLGFIGSNLAIQLVTAGAQVTIIDSSEPGCGANLHNVRSIADHCTILDLDIADGHRAKEQIRKAHVIFNLAGEISHVHSMQFPERDLRINSLAHLRFLQVCAQEAPGVRIVYAGTRQVYGIPEYLPVDEDHAVRPVDFNGVHKFAATMYHLMFTRIRMLDAIVIRLSNVYGPRMALGIPCQGFLSTFIRRLATGQPLEVYGDGTQVRDPLYIDDAVAAFLIAGTAQAGTSSTFNVGGPDALDLRTIAEVAVSISGRSCVVMRPFPAERKQIDIGSYCTDWRRIRRELGWSPRVRFAEGLKKTLEFYASEMEHYAFNGEDACCNLSEHTGGAGRLVYVGKLAKVPESRQCR